MNTTTTVSTTTNTTHPLGPVTEDEIRQVKDTLAAAGLLTESVRFAFCGLEEPGKAAVLAFAPGDPVDRCFRVLLLDLAGGASAT